jgi:predicted nucleic acid-binding protein
MSGFLIDTNVISEVARPKPDKGVLAFLANQPSPHISVITIHELVYGIERLETGSRRQRTLQGLIDEFLATFSENILSTTEPIARAAGTLRSKAHKEGHTAGLADALIAATALVHGLTVATRNVRDFEKLGVPSHDPWES